MVSNCKENIKLYESSNFFFKALYLCNYTVKNEKACKSRGHNWTYDYRKFIGIWQINSMNTFNTFLIFSWTSICLYDCFKLSFHLGDQVCSHISNPKFRQRTAFWFHYLYVPKGVLWGLNRDFAKAIQALIFCFS